MATATQLMTAEEFLALPDSPGAEELELVRGVIVMTPPATAGHGHRAMRLQRAIEDFVVRHQLGLTSGEGGYRLSRNPDTVRAPDAAWITFDRLPDGKFPEDVYPDAAPNLAIEVVSATDRDSDIADKLSDYFEAGTVRVWVVRSRQRTITVHRADGDSHTYRGSDKLSSDDAGFPVPGFELIVSSVFA